MAGFLDQMTNKRKKKKKSAKRRDEADLLNKSDGNIETFQKEKQLHGKKLKNNLILYDDKAREKFNIVARTATKYKTYAKDQKELFNIKLKEKEKEEEKEQEQEGREQAEQVTFEECNLAEAIFLLQQVAASLNEADSTIFCNNLRKVTQEIETKVIPLTNECVAEALKETHLVITGQKIIRYLAKYPLTTEKTIPYAFDDVVPPIDEADIASNFVESADYSMLAKVKQETTNKNLTVVDENAVEEFVKLCIDCVISELFGGVRFLIIVMENTLKYFDLDTITDLPTNKDKEIYIKDMLKDDWIDESWIITEAFEKEGAPMELSKTSIDKLHKSFMNYMQKQIDDML